MWAGAMGSPDAGEGIVRILVVEDDAKIASFVAKGLREAGYAAETAADGEEGLYLAEANRYDAAIVDLMLPKRDGLSLIEAMRERQVRTPVIILSAKRSVDDRVRGLQAGGDDYLTKPFAFSELLARVQALVRRTTGMAEPTVLEVADLRVDLLKREVIRAGASIQLQPKEFALLEFLMRHAGRVVSKTMIMEHVWNYHFDPETNVVEARICRLRDKIDKGRKRTLIHTVRGVGYVLREEQ